MLAILLVGWKLKHKPNRHFNLINNIYFLSLSLISPSSLVLTILGDSQNEIKSNYVNNFMINWHIFMSLLGKNWGFSAQVAGHRWYLSHYGIKMHKGKSGEFYCCDFPDVMPELPRWVIYMGRMNMLQVYETPENYTVFVSLCHMVTYVFLHFMCLGHLFVLQ